jgi:multidrug efflux pump subunit AcrA (membrane-fusion protein)
MWRILLVAITINAQAATPDRNLPLDPKQQAALGVTLATVQVAQSEPLQTSATVTVPTGREVAVTAPYPGQMVRILAGIGDSVKAGAALGQFVSPSAGEARRLQQEALIESRLFQSVLDREQALFEDGLIPAARLQAARAKVEAAQAIVRARDAEVNASGMQFESGGAQRKGPNPSGVAAGYATGSLRAPMAGVVTEVFTPIGQRVDTGAVLFRLVDVSQLQFDIQLAPEKAALLRVGDTVTAPQRQASAVVTGVSQAVDSSQLARIRARIQSQGNLQLGELLSVQVHPGLRKAGAAWRVPSRCLTQWQGKPVLFVATSSGFSVQSVELISSNDDTSVVAGPLSADSKVAVSGVASLRALLQSER